MEPWKEKAIQLLPQHRDDIVVCASIDDLWDRLEILFVDAHREKPIDSGTISGIYGYARWCMIPSEERWVAAQAVDFFECLPDDTTIWEELPRHMSYEEFLSLGELFRYYRTPEQYKALIEFAVTQFVARAREQKKAIAPRKFRPARRRDHSE